jgi:hypothetical protein
MRVDVYSYLHHLALTLVEVVVCLLPLVVYLQRKDSSDYNWYKSLVRTTAF